MADLNMKKTALQLLVVNGILTQEEVDKCIRVLSDEDDGYTGIEKLPQSYENSDVVFEDSKISVTYKGARKVSNLFFGDGIEFRFVIQNKTCFKMRVSATDITINDFVVSGDELICSEATPNKKTIDSFHLYSRALDDVDVTDVDDIYSLELAIKYEISDIDFEYESESVEINI